MDRGGGKIRIIDTALLPEYRRTGLGGDLMRDLLAERAARGLPVRIHVEVNNPALCLYHRLGFRESGTTGVYFEMEWRSESA